jgi:hypothetical protein
MTILPIMTLSKGEEIYLQANAVNSSESFRGRGLYLNYKISQIDSSMIPDSIKAEKDQSNMIQAYAVLKSSGKIYDIDYITKDRPYGKKYLKCTLSIISGEPAINGTSGYARYNLDNFFTTNKITVENNLEFNKDPNISPDSMKWNYLAKIKIYNGYSLLEDVVKNNTN